MAKTPQDLRPVDLKDATTMSISKLESGSAVNAFPTKYNSDIAVLQKKINELVELTNLQNQIIKNLEKQLINAVNSQGSKILTIVDQTYVKKTDD